MQNLNKYLVVILTGFLLIQPGFSALADYSSLEYPSYTSTYDYTYPTYSYNDYSSLEYPTYTPTYDYTYPSYTYPSYSYNDYSSLEYPTYSDYSYPTYSSLEYPTYTPTYTSYSSLEYPSYSYPTYSSLEYPTYTPTYTYTYPTYSYTPTYTYSSSCSSGSCPVYTLASCSSSCCGSSCPASLSISCSASPNPVQINQNVNFNAYASGGTGSYTYSWSGNCTGSSSTCSRSFSTNGSYSATVNVTSGSQTTSTTCSVNVQGGSSSLSISKLVRNITDGIGLQESVSADPSERLGFSIQVTNTGSNVANNVWINDTLPSNISYGGNLQIDGSYQGGDIISGINIGNLSVGQSKTVTFEAQVGSSSQFGSGTVTLTNYARTWADNVSQIQDTATINVYGQSTSTSLSMDKLVRNNNSSTTWQNSVSANPSDSISYSIRITNNGNATANNVMVRDILPGSVNYSGNLKLDGNYQGGDILSGINIGSFYAGQSKTITFDAQISANISYGNSINLINTANVWADNISQISDTATVNVYGNYGNAIFTVNKLVKNLSDGTAFQETVAADPSEIVTFSIQVTGSGFGTAQNVYVKDSLPAKIIYQGNLKIDNIASSGDIISGFNIGSLYAGQSKTITFDAIVANTSQFTYGTTELINAVIAYNTSYSTTDTAKVTVTKATVAGAITEIPTGVNPIYFSILIAFLLSLSLYLLLPYLENSRNPLIRKMLGAYYKTKLFIFR